MPSIFSIAESRGLYIVAVDGVTVKEKSIDREKIVTALVKPGEHSITFGYADGSSHSTAPATIVFDAATGVTSELTAADQPSFGGCLLARLIGQGDGKG